MQHKLIKKLVIDLVESIAALYEEETIQNFDWQKISSPEELKNFYSTLNYGVFDTETNSPYSDTNIEVLEKWHLLSPTQLVEYKTGICYDTSKMTDVVLTNLGIEHKNYFMHTNSASWKSDASHTFNLYKDENGGYWKWLEGSWGEFKNNNLESENIYDLLTKIVDCHKKHANTDNVLLREIISFPEPGIGIEEFYNRMLANPAISI